MPRRRQSVGLVGPDDERRRETADALTERGFRVEPVREGSLGDVTTARSVDVILVEHRNTLDAVGILQRIHEIDPLYPAVVYATEGSEVVAARCIEYDVEAYVPASEGIEALASTLAGVEPVDAPRRDAEGMLNALLSMVPRSLSIYFKDTAGRHVAVTEDFPGLIGPPYFKTPDGAIVHHGGDVVGKTDFDLYPTFLAEKTVEDEARIMHDDEPIVNELERSLEADGTEVFVSTSKAPWYDSAGRLRGIVGVTMDVTDREKHRRGLERQNERLERFASVLSHDLRNPLGIAQGRLNELSGPDDAQDDVEWALDRMDELIEEVLALARQGSVVDDPRPVELSDPATDAWGTVEGGGTLQFENLPTVSGDPERLRALFENLFRNAVEHGGEDVGVTVTGTEDGFRVEDDGPGIDEDIRDEIFDHGFTTDQDGTGFGLSIVREIVEAHGWEVGICDGELGGACFQFTVQG